MESNIKDIILPIAAVIAVLFFAIKYSGKVSKALVGSDAPSSNQKKARLLIGIVGIVIATCFGLLLYIAFGSIS
ncbi:hypothetical protein EXS56_01140 [Candidatus Kaiserbacteria bacterium]|nr:hypothetical protein [Candidatus Kaiserbacteria bacterium]